LYYLTNSCIPCNASDYDLIGCEGNCDGSDLEKSGFVYCEEGGCKEGYYNLNGFCLKCSTGSEGCSKCTYEVQEDHNSGNFKCHECINNEYRLTEYGKCEHCELYLCDECHYEENNGEAICDKCSDDAYNNTYGKCQECREIYIGGGYCKVCSDNDTEYEEGSCWCIDGYKLFDNSKCLPCPYGCSKCDYNSTINDFVCIKCFSGYTMNEDKKCIECENDCEYCSLNEKDKSTTCLSCYSGILLPDNKCILSIEGCSKTIIDETSLYKNESVCEDCYYYGYVLNQNQTCTYCNSIPDTGNGCDRCIYDENEKKYKCLRCYNSYNFIYINNTYQCFHNDDKEDERHLYGCIEAIYNEKTNNYECFKCKEGFIYITNNKTCENYYDIELSYCLEAEKLGTFDFPLYSCKRCSSDYVLVTNNSTKINECSDRIGNLSYCLEGIIDKNDNIICTKCVNHATLNSSGICECNYDSFAKSQEWCYKCDDEIEGNPGCNAEKGCSYLHPNNELDCNECKEGYFKYTHGQCFSCNFEIPNCGKCYVDEELKCQNCIDIYKLNEKNNKCELNECKEYPEISPGCIICNDKLDEFKSKKKCQSCKYGYFKTKNATCVYCRLEKYGGPGCYECGYELNEDNEEIDNITCNNCFSIDKYYDYDNYYYDKYHNNYISVLSSKGKCYISKYDFSDPCLKYEFIKDKSNIEKLTCTICYKGYYLDSKGNCISFIDNIETIPNCYRQILVINNLKLYYYPNNYENKIQNYYDINYYINNFNIFNEYFKNRDYLPIKSICDDCNSGYYINNKGECEILNIEKCIVRFIIQNINQRNYSCNKLCNEENYPFIYLKFINDSIDYNFEYYHNISNIDYDNLKSIDNILNDFNIINDNELKEFVLNHSICYIPDNKTINNTFEGCSRLLYIPKTKLFQCLECRYNYKMDYENNKCNYIGYTEYCDYENLGSETNPIYTCKKCNYDYLTLVTFKNGIKDCLYSDEDISLENCIEANASTTYLYPVFSCTKCIDNYTPFYSEFYQKIICQNNKDEIKENNTTNLTIFENITKFPVNKDGNCEENYFTPDNKSCYHCNAEDIGMPGCKGKCSFSLKRNDIILCESGCEDGYLEVSKGICEKCSNLNSGCNKCHYEKKNYSLDYPYLPYYFYYFEMLVFVCDKCGTKLELLKDGLDCDKCKKVGNKEDEKCNQCLKNDYWIDSWGFCQQCIITEAVINGKCVGCSNKKKGGIENCLYCQQNEKGNGIVCKECYEDYILMTNNNTCIKRDNNTKLKEFNNCLELKSENNKLVCSRCKPQFSLLKAKDNNSKCTYLPIIFDYNIRNYYYFHYYYDIFSQNSSEFYKYLENDYNFRRSIYFPCKESINIGTEENPLYTCTKCYNIFDYEEYDDKYYDYYFRDYYNYCGYRYESNYQDEYNQRYTQNYPVKIIDITQNNISYCILTNRYTESCLESTYEILNGEEIYNCTKCRKNYQLEYSSEKKIYYCRNPDDIKDKCFVEYCDTCVANNFYFCYKCYSSNYEINKITGACVKKTETIPSVTWKDVFRLIMNDQKEINGQTIIGPSLTLRGITSSQINTRHAFLVYLTFKIKYTLRYLQKETIKIPAICQIKNEVNKTDDNINIVDYECIGNNTDNTPLNELYQLESIEEGNNIDTIKNADFNIINKIISETNLTAKYDSTFDITDDLIIFKIDLKEKNINSNEYHEFIFTLNGTINQNISLMPNTPYEALVNMYNIKDKPKCTFYLENGNKAKLNIILKLKNDIKKEKISFLNQEIKVGNYSIYIPLLTDINLINIIEKEQEKCSVEFCKSCSFANNYFCAICNDSDYSVNKYTGSCVKKTKFVPMVTWKDIYGFKEEGHLKINGKIIYGLYYKLRGITSNEINEKHAFSLYLNFRSNTKIRYLQGTKKVQTLCINGKNYKEKTTDINIIDYECIGIDNEKEINDNYKLISIENGDNDEIIINNLNHLVISGYKDNDPHYKGNNNMLIFVIDENDIKDKKSKNNIFNFRLNGKIINNKKTYSNCVTSIPVEMYQINQTANFTFCSKDKEKGTLDVLLDLKNDKDNKTISFGNSEIQIEKDVPMYIPALNKIKLNYEYSPKKIINKKNSKIKTSVVVICIILPIILVGAIIGLAMFLTQRKRTINNTNLDNTNAISGSQIYNSSSTNAVDKAE